MPALVSAAVGVGVGVNVLQAACLAEGQRLVPSLAAVPDVISLLVLASFPGWMLWMRRVRPICEAQQQVWLCMSLVLAQLLVSAGGAAAIMSTAPDPYFSDRYLDRSTLRDGQLVYLFQDGMFCDLKLYVRTPRRIRMSSLGVIRRARCRPERPPRLTIDGQRVLVISDEGVVLSTQTQADMGLILDRMQRRANRQQLDDLEAAEARDSAARRPRTPGR